MVAIIDWYTVMPTLAPVLITIFFDIYSEYTWRQVYNRHILELIFVAIAILVSIFYEAILLDNSKNRMIYAGIVAMVVFCAVTFYAFFYDKEQYENKYFVNTAVFFLLLAICTLKIGRKFFELYEERS